MVSSTWYLIHMLFPCILCVHELDCYQQEELISSPLLNLEFANTSITHITQKTINRCVCSFKNQFTLVKCLYPTAQSTVEHTSGPESF